jgi:hypothetical protein
MWRSSKTRVVALTVLLVISAARAYPQSPGQGDDDVQSWNDLQLTVPMGKHIDFTTMGTARFGDNVSRAVDGRYMIGFVLKPNKAIAITPFYWYINSRNARGLYKVENQLNLRASYKFPTKGFGLSHRSQYEYRMRSPANSWRYRAQMTIDKQLPEKWIAGLRIFAWDEVFYDSLTKRFSRNRIAAGISKALTKQLSLDVYYMRQNDGTSHPGDLNVILTAWKVRM